MTVIQRAIEACENTGYDPNNHFRGVTKMVKLGSGAERLIEDFMVTLYPFVCTIESGEIILHEHAAISWLTPKQLHTLDWAEADLPVIEMYLAALEYCT